MRDIPAGIVTALESSIFRPLFLVEIQFDTVLRFSSAYGAITVAGVEYLGAANLGNITSAKENSDLDPNELKITLAGISDASLSAVGSSNYLNRDIAVRVAMFDEDGGVIDDAVMNYFIGKTDDVKFNYGKQSSIVVTARDRLADWSRPRVERNMNSDQQATYPGDKGFEFVGQIADKKIIWPKGEFFE
jgi:hypothetical protein